MIGEVGAGWLFGGGVGAAVEGLGMRYCGDAEEEVGEGVCLFVSPGVENWVCGEVEEGWSR